MKRVALLHGTDGNTNVQWYPWLRKQLEANGYSIYGPDLPENHTPNRFLYDKFLQESGWDFKDNLVIGHSSGATTVLNLLQQDWFPKVKTIVLLGTFLNEDLLAGVDWYEPGQFDNLFPDSFDVEKIKRKASNIYFVHGDNDPYCDYDDAKRLCDKLGGKFIAIKNGHHLGDTSGLVELPQLISALEQDSVL
jgi:predicted alpha/beta hydrolase family esterase